MLITFVIENQKITHDLGSRNLVAGSSGIVQAAFSFDGEWDELDKVIVFSNTSSKCPRPIPVRHVGEKINIPQEVLKAGKLYVSVVGFGEKRKRLTTIAWDIQQAIAVKECGKGGGCELLRNFVSDDSAESGSGVVYASDDEVAEYLEELFGNSGGLKAENSDEDKEE